MSDLDFDELDRAVSSLMKSKGSNDEPAPTAEEPKDAGAVPTSEVKTSDASEVAGTDDQKGSPRDDVKTGSEIQKKSSGRYMDMVPPKQQPQGPALQTHGMLSLSSLTQSTDSTPPAIAEPAKTPAPFHDIIPPSKTSPSMPAEPAVGSPETVAAEPQESSNAPLLGASDVQAQLEAALNEDSKPEDDELTPAPSPAENTPEEPLVTPDLSDTPRADDNASSREHTSSEEVPSEPVSPTESMSSAKPEQSATTTSPFLADAKVEKRPLGGSAPDEQDKEQAENTHAETTHSTDAGQFVPSVAIPGLQPEGQEGEAAQQTQPIPMPPEFHEDLLAVEADKQDDEAQKKTPEASYSVEQQASAAHVGPLSIAQQYKEKTSTGDQSHTPIYDTNVQPLTHPPLKKSGWGIVVVIVGVIVFSVAIAAALYFTGIL